MKTNDYLIAGIKIRVEGDSLCESVAALPGFDVFATYAEGVPDALFAQGNLAFDPDAMRADYGNVPGLEKVLYTDSNEIASSCFATSSEGGYLFCSYSNTGPEALVLETAADGSCTRFTGDFVPHLLKFACWMAFNIASLPSMTVALHASTILYGGKAVLFLGESGTGKSTHTRLWLDHIEGAKLLNDDSPLIKVSEESANAFGSPWSGKTHCYVTGHYPLAACVRLSQAPYNRISRLGVVASYAALHPSCPPPFAYDRRLYDMVADFLNALLENVPVYHLECLPDAEAARLSCSTIFGECRSK